MDIQNHYYGHSAALALHAGLPSIRHIDGLVQHGWTVYSPSLVHFADFARLPRTARRLVWSHAARGWDAARDPFPTTAIGAPFLYLSALTAGSRVERSDRAVVFPVHDTRLVKIGGDDQAFARELAGREGPSVICLHPEDLDQPEKRRVWTQFGHTVVSAGSRRDPLFLGRVLKLVRSSRRVVSNLLSTAVVYAAAEGTDTAIYGPEVSLGDLGSEVAQRTRALWPEFHEAVAAGIRQRIALAELGQSHLLEPAALREALGWDHHSPGPLLNYWAGAPVRKAGAVLGLVQRPAGAQDAGSSADPLAFLRHPMSHLPGRLPALPRGDELLADPLVPATSS
ncbi:hypothetical protein ACFOYW_08950 [Gryllotalpicola reticulitermitis]|uniref:Uncharacterized protein n=1 Tax=Gryllotalpicola reticulitermitis TaxID=1184153 RepID=A0ABV8Q7Q9_9MICO